MLLLMILINFDDDFNEFLGAIFDEWLKYTKISNK